MLDLIDSTTPLDDGGLPVGNYGAPDGLPSARALAAQIMGVDPANVVVNGSSSLNLMHDLVCHAYTHGIGGQQAVVSAAQGQVPLPQPRLRPAFPRERALRHRERPGAHARGRPRHGDDRSSRGGRPRRQGCLVRAQVANPTGITYSGRGRSPVREHPSRCARLPHLLGQRLRRPTPSPTGRPAPQLFDALAEAGQSDLVYEFGSTAKVTFPKLGHGVRHRILGRHGRDPRRVLRHARLAREVLAACARALPRDLDGGQGPH